MLDIFLRVSSEWGMAALKRAGKTNTRNTHAQGKVPAAKSSL